MGLFDFLGGGDPETKQRKAIDKAKKTLGTPYGPTENRMGALDKLASIGTHDAILAMLERFTVKTPNGITDEDEKAQVAGVVANFREAAVEPIGEFLRKHDDVTRPLRILTDIAGPARTAAIVIEVLGEIGTEWVRVPQKKVELIAHLGIMQEQLAEQAEGESDRPAPDIGGALLPFLEDVDDDARLAAIDLLFGETEDRVKDPLLELLLDGDSSNRIRIALTAGFVEKGWAFGDLDDEKRDELKESLPDRFRLSKAGVIEKKG